MTEALEFSISQYADGSLPEGQRAALEEILARDEAARALLAEYRKLDGAIAQGAGKLPEIRWDALHRHLSEHISAESEVPESYKIGSSRSISPGGWMALAASLLIVCGVAVELLRPNAGVTPSPVPPPQIVAVVNVTGPEIEAPAGAPAADVTLTAAATADAASMYPLAEGVVYQPSHVTIASAGLVHSKDLH